MKNREFILAVERLVNPIEGGAMHVIQQYNAMLPVSVQHKLISKSGDKSPYMGFIVDPYATFNCFRITDLEYFEQKIHDNFKLIKSRVFADGPLDYYLIISSFGVRTSAFFGNRIEAYVICEDVNTGMLSWVIIDVMTNTIGYEQRFGLVPANAEVSVTTGFDGSISVSAKRDETSLDFSVPSSGTIKKLDPRLWIEGNLSVGYGKALSANGDVFSLLFDVREVESAVDVGPVSNLTNNWYSDAIETTPSVNLVFPYAQHFISSSPGAERTIKDQAQMEQIVQDLDFTQLKVYSSSGMFKLQQYITLGLVILVALLILIIVS